MKKLILNEDSDMPHFGDKKGIRGDKDWFGIEGARYIDHGEWADPEVSYKGKLINYWDIVDYCESGYADYCEEHEVDTHKYDVFDYMKDHPEEIENALYDLEIYAKPEEEGDDGDDDSVEESLILSEEKSPLYDLRSNLLELPNGDAVYLEYKEGNLIAGHAVNTGIIPEWEIRYDWDLSVDENIQHLYEFILENNPELNESLSDAEIKKLEKELRELRSADEPDGARIEEIKKQLEPYWEERQERAKRKYANTISESADPEYVIWVFCSDENKWRMWGGSHKASVDKDFLTRINKRIREWNNASDDTPDLYTDVKVVKNGEEPVNEDYANIDPEDSDVKEYKYKGQDVFRLIATRLEGDRTQMFVIGLGTKLEDASFEPVVRSARYTTEESLLFLSAERAEAFLAKFKDEYPDADSKGLHVAEYNPINEIETLIPITTPCGKAYLGMQKTDKKDDDKKDESLNEDVEINSVNSADEIYEEMIGAINNYNYDVQYFTPNLERLKLFANTLARTIEFPLAEVEAAKDRSGKWATARLFCKFGEKIKDGADVIKDAITGIVVIFNGGAIFDTNIADDSEPGKGIGQFYFEKSPDKQNTYIQFTPWEDANRVFEVYTYIDEFTSNFRKDYLKYVKKIDPTNLNPKNFLHILSDAIDLIVEEDAGEGDRYSWRTLDEFKDSEIIQDAIEEVKRAGFLGDILKYYSMEDLYKHYKKVARINYPNLYSFPD